MMNNFIVIDYLEDKLDIQERGLGGANRVHVSGLAACPCMFDIASCGFGNDRIFVNDKAVPVKVRILRDGDSCSFLHENLVAQRDIC